jgi:hypothetical protein
MTYTITIDLDNAAFEDGSICYEMQTILDRLSRECAWVNDAHELPQGTILDSNGNSCGKVGLT